MSDKRTDGGVLTNEMPTSTPTVGSMELSLGKMVTIARTEFRLGVRSYWAFALTGLFLVFGLMLVTFSGSAVGPDGLERIVASLVGLAVYLVPLAALAFGYDAVVGRDEEGWLEVLFALPLSRGRILIGLFLGRAGVLAGATIIGFGVVGFVLLNEFGVRYWPSYLTFLGATVALGVVFLAIGFLVSALAREKTHAIGLALLAWLWFVLIHDLVSLALVAAFEIPGSVVHLLALANPATAVRILVLGQLETSTGGFAAALAASDLSSGVILASLAIWVLVSIGIAVAVVRRRRI